MTDTVVELDPQLTDGVSDAQRLAAEICVLRARADALRGPQGGDRALVLALQASELEELLGRTVGVEQGARLLRLMEQHPATTAAVERWRYAHDLAQRLLDESDTAGSAD